MPIVPIDPKIVSGGDVPYMADPPQLFRSDRAIGRLEDYAVRGKNGMFQWPLAGASEQLRGKYPEQQPLSTLTLTATHAPFPSAAQKFRFDRPVILWPLANSSNSNTVSNFVFACPSLMLDPAVGQLDPATLNTAAWIRSVNSGVLYLPNGGEWWLFNLDNTTPDYLVIDASDPVIAMMYLAIPGNHTTQTHPADILVDTTVGGILILAARRDRKAVSIQNTGAATNCRISIGFTPLATRGILLAVGAQPLFLAGPTLALQEIRGITAAGNTNVSVQEYI